MAKNPQRSLQELLVREVGLDAAKRMVREWKELGVDLSNGNTIHKLAERNEILFSMASLSNLGFIDKILYIKKQLQD